VARLAEHMQVLAERVEGSHGAEREKLVFEAAAHGVAEVLGATRASLLMLNEAGDALDVASIVGSTLPIEELPAVPLGEGVAGLAFENASPVVVESLDEAPHFALRAKREGYASKSFTIAPVSRDGDRLGLLCAADRSDGGTFGSGDAGLMRVLALQISELLAVGGQYPASGEAEVTAPLELEETSDGDAELARVVCDVCAHEVEPEPLLRAALGALSRELSAAPVSIFLFDPESGMLRLEAECDGGAREERASLSPSGGLTGVVFASGQLVAASHPGDDPRFDPESDTPADGVATPLLCVPLVLRGKVVGVFRAFLDDRAVASARTGEVLKAALSALIRNVLLYRSLVASIDEVAEARRSAKR